MLRLLVEGASVAQVGRQLFMSPSTVKTHIGKIYEKLGAHNRASAVIAAVRLGLVGRRRPLTAAAIRRSATRWAPAQSRRRRRPR